MDRKQIELAKYILESKGYKVSKELVESSSDHERYLSLISDTIKEFPDLKSYKDDRGGVDSTKYLGYSLELNRFRKENPDKSASDYQEAIKSEIDRVSSLFRELQNKLKSEGFIVIKDGTRKYRPVTAINTKFFYDGICITPDESCSIGFKCIASLYWDSDDFSELYDTINPNRCGLNLVFYVSTPAHPADVKLYQKKLNKKSR